MSTTVDDIHHRHGHLHSAHPAKVAIKGQARFFSSNASHGHGNSQDGVSTQTALIVSAVQLNHRAVNEGLVRGFHSDQGVSDFAINVSDSGKNTLAAIALQILVAKLKGFTHTSGSTRRDCGTTHRTTFEPDFSFYRRITTAINNFASNDVNDCAHAVFLFS